MLTKYSKEKKDTNEEEVPAPLVAIFHRVTFLKQNIYNMPMTKQI